MLPSRNATFPVACAAALLFSLLTSNGGGAAEPWEELVDQAATPSPSPSESASPSGSASPTKTTTPAPTPKPALTREDVVELSRAKISDAIIIQKIRKSGVIFALEVDDLIALKKAGVSGPVIQAMSETETGGVSTPTPSPSATVTPGDESADGAAPAATPTNFELDERAGTP